MGLSHIVIVCSVRNLTSPTLLCFMITYLFYNVEKKKRAVGVGSEEVINRTNNHRPERIHIHLTYRLYYLLPYLSSQARRQIDSLTIPIIGRSQSQNGNKNAHEKQLTLPQPRLIIEFLLESMVMIEKKV